jgi:hypothetical protein
MEPIRDPVSAPAPASFTFEPLFAIAAAAPRCCTPVRPRGRGGAGVAALVFGLGLLLVVVPPRLAAGDAGRGTTCLLAHLLQNAIIADWAHRRS